IRVRGAQRSRLPPLRFPACEGNLEGDDVFEEAFFALAQLCAARRVTGERVRSRNAGSPWRQLGAEAAEEGRQVFHRPPGGGLERVPRPAGFEPRYIASGDFLELRPREHLAGACT